MIQAQHWRILSLRLTSLLRRLSLSILKKTGIPYTTSQVTLGRLRVCVTPTFTYRASPPERILHSTIQFLGSLMLLSGIFSFAWSARANVYSITLAIAAIFLGWDSADLFSVISFATRTLLQLTAI